MAYGIQVKDAQGLTSLSVTDKLSRFICQIGPIDKHCGQGSGNGWGSAHQINTADYPACADWVPSSEGYSIYIDPNDSVADSNLGLPRDSYSSNTSIYVYRQHMANQRADFYILLFNIR